MKSPPLSVLLKLMDVPSDDFFAEMLTKQLGVRFGGSGSIQAGAGVISQVISSFGLHPAIVDGSGLSRSDRSSPRQIVALLRLMSHTPMGHVLSDSLPVVGVSGTVQRIAAHTAAQGRCRAKTGTLNYVTNLAGYCIAHNNHVHAFALMIDGPPNWTADQLLGRMLPDESSVQDDRLFPALLRLPVLTAVAQEKAEVVVAPRQVHPVPA